MNTHELLRVIITEAARAFQQLARNDDEGVRECLRLIRADINRFLEGDVNPYTQESNDNGCDEDDLV